MTDRGKSMGYIRLWWLLAQTAPATAGWRDLETNYFSSKRIDHLLQISLHEIGACFCSERGFLQCRGFFSLMQLLLNQLLRQQFVFIRTLITGKAQVPAYTGLQ